jgi:hypothetical protein
MRITLEYGAYLLDAALLAKFANVTGDSDMNNSVGQR